MAGFTVTFDWGARSKALRTLHASLGAKKSFLLLDAPLPVAAGVMKVSDTGVAWDIAPVMPLKVAPVAGTFTATADVPADAKALRVDFDLRVTVDKQTASCLEFRQLFMIAAGGEPTSRSIRRSRRT